MAKQYSFSSAQIRHEGRKRWIFCMKSYEKSENKIKFLQFSPFLAVTDTNRIWAHNLEIEMDISALKCLDHLATPCIHFYNAFCLILIGKKKKAILWFLLAVHSSSSCSRGCCLPWVCFLCTVESCTPPRKQWHSAIFTDGPEKSPGHQKVPLISDCKVRSSSKYVCDVVICAELPLILKRSSNLRCGT